MKKEWLTKFLLPCVPGMVLAGLGYLLMPGGKDCWEHHWGELSFLRSFVRSLLQRQEVTYYSECFELPRAVPTILSYLSVMSIKAGLVAGLVALLWVGIRRKRVSPTGIWLLVLSLGVLVWRSLL